MWGQHGGREQVWADGCRGRCAAELWGRGYHRCVPNSAVLCQGPLNPIPSCYVL